jgi:hypothetical protein
MYRSTHAMFTLSGSVGFGVLAERRHRPATETAARLDRALAAIDRALAASTNPGMSSG